MRTLVVATTVAIMFTLAVARPAAERPQWPGLYIPNHVLYFSMHWALVGASGWLERPECRAIFSEFHDQTGRPLTAKLDELALDGRTYLQHVLFRDGSQMKPCQRPSTIMFTQPGSRVVFVCGRQTEEAIRQDRARINAIVIHEVLHTLGLGENPPTSEQITNIVLKRCRR